MEVQEKQQWGINQGVEPQRETLHNGIKDGSANTEDISAEIANKSSQKQNTGKKEENKRMESNQESKVKKEG